jgi:flagellum-specific peptidoglycan hydrolase FlgJ
MTKNEFCKWVYLEAIKATDISPVFVTAQAALESGWGKSCIGNYNLFGITKGSNWTGKTILITTHEIFPRTDVKFTAPEEVIGINRLEDGRYKYTVKRLFKDFQSLEECLSEHSRIFQKPGYADAWPYRNQRFEFARRIVNNVGCKYATDPNYYNTMCAMIKSVQKYLTS